MSDIRIIAIGSAIQDVFLSGKILTPVNEDGSWVEELPIGSKADLEKIIFSTGGGATNAAVTFARQGLTTGFMGAIGRDPAGQAIIDVLKKEKVSTDLVIYNEELSTGYSVVLLAPNGDRTILTYRGASTYYETGSFDLDRAYADWYYVSSLAGNLELLEKILNYANDRHIRVAINPGNKELDQREELRRLLKTVEILAVNKDEAGKLFDADNSWDLVREAVSLVPIVVITDGPNGAVAGDRQANHICAAGLYEDVPVVDRTGAGDAFASGFAAKIAIGAPLQEAVVFASANSTSVVSQIGAKQGILNQGSQLHGMDMHCEPLQVNR